MQDSFDKHDENELERRALNVLKERTRKVEQVTIDSSDSGEPVELNQDALNRIAGQVYANEQNSLEVLKVLTLGSDDNSGKLMVSAAFMEKFLVALVDLFSQEGDDWGDYLVNEAEWNSDTIDIAHPAYIIFESMRKFSEAISLDLDDLPVVDTTEEDVCAVGNEYQFYVQMGDRVRTYSWAYSSSNYEELGVKEGQVVDFFWSSYPVGVVIKFDDMEQLHEVQACFLEPIRENKKENEDA